MTSGNRGDRVSVHPETDASRADRPSLDLAEKERFEVRVVVARFSRRAARDVTYSEKIRSAFS